MTDAKQATKTTTRSASARTATKNDGFTDDERAAMKEHAKELKAARSGKVDGAAEIQAKIDEMNPADRAIAERVHAIITASAPELELRTWYGMPAYAKDGKVLCFFQPAEKFKARYCTLGFNDPAQLDEGSMWATAFGITQLTAADEKKIAQLVRKAAG
jgi:uncharacterized protein YdhG (YjbR/CyaY superfamily)